ncbi:hypothetical protein ACLOAV_007910 [Pseudogymnoascus australis]
MSMPRRHSRGTHAWQQRRQPEPRTYLRKRERGRRGEGHCLAKFRCRQKPATKNCSARATILAPDATISEGLGYREELVGEYREAIGALKARVAAQKAELKLARDELERGWILPTART